jgi:rhodanese-related sulfurtransferase
MNPAFDKKVRRTIRFTVPLMSVEELKSNTQKLRIFDAREREEFGVSHIPGAEYIGYKNFDITSLIPIYPKIRRSWSIAPSVTGAKRSQRSCALWGLLKCQSLRQHIRVGERGYPVVDASGKEVKKVHTYNKDWSRWVDESKAKIIW